jgi:hypothetical protein
MDTYIHIRSRGLRAYTTSRTCVGSEARGACGWSGLSYPLDILLTKSLVERTGIEKVIMIHSHHNAYCAMSYSLERNQARRLVLASTSLALYRAGGRKRNRNPSTSPAVQAPEKLQEPFSKHSPHWPLGRLVLWQPSTLQPNLRYCLDQENLRL